ncbi:formylglycine-generating enzyme family protein [Myxococcota bacterium]
MRLLAPNAWGLYDMLGNAHEWCGDGFVLDLGTDAVTDPWGPVDGLDRVLRGGDWLGPAWLARFSSRDRDAPDFRFPSIGFRPVRSLGWTRALDREAE